jgi:hypothetical protein
MSLTGACANWRVHGAALTDCTQAKLDWVHPPVDQKSTIKPQSATPIISINHSEGFNASNLPSLTMYDIIAHTHC